MPRAVLLAALRGATAGAAGLAMHAVLEHGESFAAAATPTEGFALVLAWAWRWDQRETLELLAIHLGELSDALDDPDAPAEHRFRLDDAVWSVSSSVAPVLRVQGAADLAARASAELPRLDPRLRQ